MDIYRDTPLRLAGYANEVGESFKPLIGGGLYTFSYVVSGGYVVGDAMDKFKREQKATGDTQMATVSAVKALVWQALASVAIPGLTINRIVAAASLATAKIKPKSVFLAKYSPTLIGLSCIPFIIKPIDHGVDLLMEHAITPAIDALLPTKSVSSSSEGEA